MRIYISGKITGLPLEQATNHFESAEKTLLEKYKQFKPRPVNPLKINPGKKKPTWEDYMAADIRELLTCDGIYMLKNWQDSRGARCEYALGRELGLVFIFEQ